LTDEDRLALMEQFSPLCVCHLAVDVRVALLAVSVAAVAGRDRLGAVVLGDLRISRSKHRVDQQPDEGDDKHADYPSHLSYYREIRSPEEHVDDRAHPHHQEEHDYRADKDPPEHALR
jgi:hypothetical protein